MNITKKELTPAGIIRAALEARSDSLAALLREDARRFIAEVALEVGRRPELHGCSPESIVASAFVAAQLQLGIGPWGIWLVPFKDRCTPVTDYRALISLAVRDGLALDISAGVAHGSDLVDFEEGTNAYLRIRKGEGSGSRADFQYAWALATMRGGVKKFIVLDAEDIQRRRAKSRSGDKGPWATDFDAMARKTAVRELVNLLPRGRAGLVQQAIAAEDAEEPGEVQEVQDPTKGIAGAKAAVQRALEATSQGE